MNTLKLKSFITMILLMLAATVSWASVTSDPVNTAGLLNTQVVLPLKLHASETVAGISGKIVYESAYFKMPTVNLGPGLSAQDYSVMGYMPQEGQFYFLVYANPIRPLPLSQTLIEFKLTVFALSSSSTFKTIQYQEVTAGSVDGLSIPQVSLSNPQISLNATTTGAADWAFYE